MILRALLALLLVHVAGTAAAHRPSVQECREAAEFIRNAALSRDNGMPRQTFLDRLQGDLILIRAHPPAMRWFAHDSDDEEFLVGAVERVFDAPMQVGEHEGEMLRSCLARLGAKES